MSSLFDILTMSDFFKIQNSQMHKIFMKMCFLPKSSKIWYTSHVRLFQNSQMHKIRTKLSFLQKSPEIRKNNGGGRKGTGDFDFFWWISLNLHQKTPTYILELVLGILFWIFSIFLKDSTTFIFGAQTLSSIIHN